MVETHEPDDLPDLWPPVGIPDNDDTNTNYEVWIASDMAKELAEMIIEETPPGESYLLEVNEVVNGFVREWMRSGVMLHETAIVEFWKMIDWMLTSQRITIFPILTRFTDDDKRMYKIMCQAVDGLGAIDPDRFIQSLEGSYDVMVDLSGYRNGLTIDENGKCRWYS